ncbi:MAG: hypothetical protein V4548_00950 [Bacteroidota bacterium]
MKKLIVVLVIFFYGCEIQNINYLTPIVVTDEPQNILTNSAILGGTVLGEGGKDVTEYGIVWSTNEFPTTQDNKIVKGTRRGTFSDSYAIFQPSTTYHYRVYAINEVGIGYGGDYEFTTSAEAPCNPVQDNRVSLFTGQTISINGIDLTHPSYGFNEGNVQLETNSYSSTARIKVQFNEVNSAFPLTGEYTVVGDYFGNNENLSRGEAKLYISNYGSGFGGATAAPGTKFYVVNDNNKLTIIFCDTYVSSNYILNGKFTYLY